MDNTKDLKKRESLAIEKKENNKLDNSKDNQSPNEENEFLGEKTVNFIEVLIFYKYFCLYFQKIV